MHLLRHYISEAITQKEKILNLQPDDVLYVYHGTGETNAPMIHGIDATDTKPRSYGGPKHKGLFVTTDPEVALRFASYGQVVLEIKVQAKDLYGTDYGGNTASKQIEYGKEDPNKAWKDKYPNSFRPYLTLTLLQGHEPQALLVGVVRPSQITRVQWKGKWYSREELLKQKPKYHPPYAREPIELEDVGFDPTDGNIAIEEFYDILATIVGKSDGLEKIVKAWAQRYKDDVVELSYKLENLGWRRSASVKIAQMLIGAYT